MRLMKKKHGVVETPGFTFCLQMWAEWSFMFLVKKVKKTFIRSGFVLDPCLNHQSTLPLSLKPDGVVSFLLGKFPARIGERPTKVFVPSVAGNVLSGLLQKFCLLEYNTCFSAVATGSFLTNLPYFQKMFNKTDVTAPPSEEEWRRIYEVFHKKSPLPALPRPLFRNVFGLEINPDTFPGARENYFCRFNSKVQSLPSDVKVLKHVWFKTATGNLFPENIWTCGAREKREEDARSGEVKTRGVLMPEGWYALFESIYSRGIELSIHDIKTSSFFLGHSMCHWGWVRYFRSVCRQGFVFEGDFKGFDTTVSEELMLRSFCLLRSCYPDSKIVDNHFMFIIKNFIYKNILTPGGWLYRCNKGLPSGTSFTSLLGTTVNLLVLIDVFLHYPAFRDLNFNILSAKFCVCGDDFVISFPRSGGVSEKIFNLIGKDFDETHFDLWLASRHGMKIKKPSLKYGDAASEKTLFGQVWRSFHSCGRISFPTPVFFFKGQKSYVNEVVDDIFQSFSPLLDVPCVSKKFSRTERQQAIINCIPKEDLEILNPKPHPDLLKFNEVLSERLAFTPDTSVFKGLGESFNFIGMTSNYWLLLKSYFTASDECASFLKTIIWKGRPNVGFTDLYWRCLLPTSKNTGNWDPNNFCRSVFVCFPLLDFHNGWLLTYFLLTQFGSTLTSQQVLDECRFKIKLNDHYYYKVFFGIDGDVLGKRYHHDGKAVVGNIVGLCGSPDTKVLFRLFSLEERASRSVLGKSSFTWYSSKELFVKYGSIVPSYV